MASGGDGTDECESDGDGEGPHEGEALNDDTDAAPAADFLDDEADDDEAPAGSEGVELAQRTVVA